MKPKAQKYILENFDTKSVKEMSQKLGLKERTIRKLLERKKGKKIPPTKASFMNEQQGAEKDIIWKALLVVLFIGFALRLSGISWGMPLFDPMEGFYHADEAKIINGAAAFPQHVINNTIFQYPTFYHYFIGILSLPLRLIFKQGTAGYYIYTYLLGRICSVLLGTVAILATYCLAKKIYDRKCALLASVFICLSMFHCQNSSWATVDVLTSLLLVFFFMTAKKAIVDTGLTRDYILAGIIFGISVGTKYTCAIMIVAFFALYVYSVIRGFPDNERKKYILMKVFNPNLFYFGLISIIIFFITSPGIIIHFPEFKYWIRVMKETGYQTYIPRTNPLAWVKHFHAITNSIGIPLVILFIFGLIFPFRKKKIEEVAMILLIFAYFGYLGSMLIPRWVIMVMPFIAILASHGIISLYEHKQKITRYFAGVIITGTILYSAFYCVSGVCLRLNDTRTQAARYIAENIPPKTAVGIATVSEKYPWRYHEWRYPQVDFNKYKEIYFLNRPDILILSSYDFKKIDEALKSNKLKADYVWDENYNKEWYFFSPPSPMVFKFYDEILNKEGGYIMLKEFKKNNFIPIGFPSPEIRIYKKNKIGQSFLL